MKTEKKMSKALKIFLGLLFALLFFVIVGIISFFQTGKKFSVLSKDNVVSVAVIYDCYKHRNRYTTSDKYHHLYMYKYQDRYFKNDVLFKEKQITDTDKKNKFLVIISKKNPKTHCVIFTQKIDKQIKFGDTLSITVDQDVLKENISKQDLFFSESTEFYDFDSKQKNIQPIDRDGLIFKIILFLIIGVVIILFGWLIYGIDLKKGNIVISNNPPKDLSPALLNSIVNSEFVKKNIFCFSLFSLGEKGYISIDMDKNILTINEDISESKNNITSSEENNTPEVESINNLPTEEKILLEFLYKLENSTIQIPKKYNEIWKNLFVQLENSCFLENKNKKYFVTNVGFMITGSVFLLISIFYFYTLYFLSFKLVLFVVGLLIFYGIMQNLLKKHSSLGRAILDKIEGYNSYLKLENKLFMQTKEGKQHKENFVYAMAINQSENWFNKIKETDYVSTKNMQWLVTKNTIDPEFITNYITNIGTTIEAIMKKPN